MTDLPTATVRTDLVSIERLGPDDISDMLSSPPRRHDDWHPDFPREDDCDGVGMVREVDCWSSRAIRQLSSGLVVGSIGFFGPPDPADDGVLEAEVGYGLVAAARGQGLMTSTLAAVLGLVDAAGVRVRAHTEPGNAASLATLRGAGFADRGVDPDDEEHQLLLVRARP